MKKMILFVIILLGVVIYSCKDGNENTETMANYSVRMTDAPGDYEAVFVNVKEVEIKTTKGDHVFPVNKRFNLLDFVDGRDTLLFSRDILICRVTQIRLVLHDDSNNVVINGITYPLETPSAQQSGLKINVQHDLVADVKNEVLLDFDAAKSIVETGSGKYILKPVIRIGTHVIRGGIKGMIIPVDACAAITATSGEDTFTSYKDRATGQFTITTSREGVYDIMIDADERYHDTVITNVNVSAGTYTYLGTIILKTKL